MIGRVMIGPVTIRSVTIGVAPRTGSATGGAGVRGKVPGVLE
jgi:hypothetical protein